MVTLDFISAKAALCFSVKTYGDSSNLSSLESVADMADHSNFVFLNQPHKSISVLCDQGC